MFLFQIDKNYLNRDAKWKTAADVEFVMLMSIDHLCKKHFGSKKHLENEKQNEMIIAKWLFKEEQAPIKKKPEKV